MKRARTILLLALSAVLIAAGLLLDQDTQVLQKAAHVCLECIGIG